LHSLHLIDRAADRPDESREAHPALLELLAMDDPSATRLYAFDAGEDKGSKREPQPMFGRNSFARCK